MRDRAAFDIDDVLRQAQLAHDHQHDRREGFVDFDALDVPERPPGAGERLLDGRNGPKTEHARLHRRNAIRDEACRRHKAALLGPALVGQHHGGRAAVQPWRVAGRNGAIVAERRLQPRERLERRARPVVLVLLEDGWAFSCPALRPARSRS